MRKSFFALLVLAIPAFAIAGTHELTLVSVKVKPKKPDGKDWDPGLVGQKPDLKVTIENLTEKTKVESPKAGGTIEHKYNLPAKEAAAGDTLKILVEDIDNLDSNDEIGKIEYKVTEDDLKAGKKDLEFNSVIKLELTFKKK